MYVHGVSELTMPCLPFYFQCVSNRNMCHINTLLSTKRVTIVYRNSTREGVPFAPQPTSVSIFLPALLIMKFKLCIIRVIWHLVVQGFADRCFIHTLPRV